MTIEAPALIELQTKIHQQNKDMGWWDNPRPFHTFVCLFHSELSEAMEGDRKNLMDDHLPEYEMFWVEVADFAIRCLDWLGSKNYEKYDFYIFERLSSKIEFLSQMHYQVSTALNLSKDPYFHDKENLPKSIAYAVSACFDFANVHQFDLLKVINEKVAYNAQRADHKRENRAAENGKKY
ncbi:hypothetical protein D5018_03725 [Parashewanella curva]|uniref:Uncharacterized protein n=1 Tax=Parashewanella curva TaxID=2338552 RepID=A0A3L8Q017_9GAMM|nr:hypothetical protein [Parashewanella curva]RLV60961.1 hypothetical protein D5018_03725 [Parashewanella curva]